MLTKEDRSIIVRQDRDMRIVYAMVNADRLESGIMVRAQRSGAAYVSVNRQGYTTLIRARLNDVG